MKKLSQWLDEFVTNGADPAEVEDWPQNTEEKDYKHLLQITFLDGCDNQYAYRVILNTDYETAMTAEQFKNLFTKEFESFDVITVPTYQYRHPDNPEGYAPAVLGYNSDSDNFYDYVSTNTLTLSEFRDMGRESNDQENN